MERFLSAGSRTVAWMAVAGVLIIGLTDWLQGRPPVGIIDLGDWPGLVVFVLCSVGVAAGALLADTRGVSEPDIAYWSVVVGLATVAVLVADPTYTVLLFAVPLTRIARRWPDPLRWRVVAGVLALALVLLGLEADAWAMSNYEAALVMFIALVITSVLGGVLGQLDGALERESEVARRDERERLAAELHDSVGHNLLATSVQLRTAQALWDADSAGAKRSVEMASHAVDEALIDTRIAVDAGRSRSEPFSLASALPELIDRIASHSLAVDLELEGPVDSVDQLTQITLYRVAQEALTNIVRHADASVVAVHHSATSDEIELALVDDGCGFDSSGDAAHLGLRGIDERLQRINGHLEVESSPGAGTTVRAVVRAVVGANR